MGNLSINNGGVATNKGGMPSIDLRYGPYESVHAAHLALSGDEVVAVGLTVGIIDGNSIVEYWYQGGTSESNLVQKQSSGNSGRDGVSPEVSISDIPGGHRITIVDATHTAQNPLSFDVMDGENGSEGTPGNSSYIYIRYAAQQPAADADMHESFNASTDKWIGIYSGATTVAPTDYGKYTWAKFIGDDGAGGGSPASYTAGQGISITNGEIGIDNATMAQINVASGGMSVDTTHMKNAPDNSAANGKDAMLLASRFDGVTLQEVTATVPEPQLGFVNKDGGTISSSTGAYYVEIDVSAAESIRYMGYNASAIGASGSAFGYYNDATWVNVKSHGSRVNSSLPTGACEYIEDVPEGATHFRTTIWPSEVQDNSFYCFLRTGKSLRDCLGILYDGIRSFEVAVKHNAGSATAASSGKKYSLLFFVNKGDRIAFTCLHRPDIRLYPSDVDVLKAAINAVDALQVFSHSGNIQRTVGQPIDMEILHSGILEVSITKTSTVSAQDIETLYNDFKDFCIYRSGSREHIRRQILASNEKGWRKIPALNLVSGKLNTAANGGITESEYHCTLQSKITVPSYGCILKFKLPQEYVASINYGNYALSDFVLWFQNNDTVELVADIDSDGYLNHSMFRFTICKASHGIVNNGRAVNEAISVEEVNALVQSGEIAIFYQCEDSVVSRNREPEKAAAVMSRKWTADKALHNRTFPTFAHCSDLHGDAVRFDNFLEWCDYFGVDAAFVTGDIVFDTPTDSTEFCSDIVQAHSTTALACVGNHDARGITNASLNSSVFGKLMRAAEGVPRTGDDNPTYYYKDFPNQLVRIIVLNTHDRPTTNPMSATSSNPDVAHITADQMSWFADSLKSTPANYGILIMYHEPESPIRPIENHTTFFRNSFLEEYTLPNEERQGIYLEGRLGLMTNPPISRIVDAFIRRISTTISWTNGGTGGSTPTISVDFSSGVNEGVEFIAHVCGHLHNDLIGEINIDTSYQLVLNVTSVKMNHDETVRNFGKGASQDAFNVYAIDRENKTVRIARIGADVTIDMKERKWMVIPYIKTS